MINEPQAWPSFSHDFAMLNDRDIISVAILLTTVLAMILPHFFNESIFILLKLNYILLLYENMDSSIYENCLETLIAI